MLNSIIDFNPLLKLNICSAKSYWNGNIYHNPCVKLVINCTVVIHCANFVADFRWWSLVSLFNIFSSKLSKISISNCQNFPFQTVKISFSKLLKFSFSKLSKISFPNCQNFPFPNCQNFPFESSQRFPFPKC